MKWTHAENAVFVAMQGMLVEEEQVIGLIAYLDELLKTTGVSLEAPWFATMVCREAAPCLSPALINS